MGAVSPPIVSPAVKVVIFQWPCGVEPRKRQAAERPASEPYHIGGAARLIDEDQPLRVEAGLAFAPALPGRSHVRALLFAGQDGFFYN